MNSMIQWDKPRRQSPVALIVSLLGAFREAWTLILIILASTFLRKSSTDGGLSLWEKFASALLGSLIATVLLQFPKVSAYFFYRFWIEDENIIITQGILEKQRTVLPIEKIQTVQLQQNFIHKLTGTCSLTMDTAGSEKPELVIDAINQNDAVYLQELINEKRQCESSLNTADKLASPTSIVSLNITDLLKLCFSENHLKTLFIIIIFILGKLNDLRDYLGFDSFKYVKDNSSLLKATTQSVLLVFTVGLLLAMVFSCIRVLVRYYDFRLVQQGNAYKISWGLLSTHSKTMRFDKVQFITWHSNWIRRKMNLLLLRFHALAEQEIDHNLHVSMPITNSAMLQQVVQSYIPVLPVYSGVSAMGIQKAYVWRKFFIVGLPVTAFICLGAYYYIGWYALLAGLGLLYQTIANLAFQRNFKFWFTGVELQIEKGVWGRTGVAIQVDRIIFVAIHSTPWQRKHGYASLELQLPGTKFKIPYLNLQEAQWLADYILAVVEMSRGGGASSTSGTYHHRAFHPIDGITSNEK